jgi:hypothetical protein
MRVHTTALSPATSHSTRVIILFKTLGESGATTRNGYNLPPLCFSQFPNIGEEFLFRELAISGLL